MRVNLPFLVFYLFLINYILSDLTNRIVDVDLEKYKNKNNVVNYALIFNSTDFKIDEEIYFKISGAFIEDDGKLRYKFFDDGDDMVEIANEMTNNPRSDTSLEILNVLPNKHETKTDNNGEEYSVNYYTITKSKDNLKGKEGYYLYLFIYVDGTYDIVNTEKNEGNDTMTIIIVVVVVVVVLLIGGIISYLIKKKKAAKAAQDNQVYSDEANINNNNAGYNNAGYNNAGNNNAGYSNEVVYNNNNNAGYNQNMNFGTNAYSNNQVYQ